MDSQSSGSNSQAPPIDQDAEARHEVEKQGRANRVDVVVIAGFRPAIAVDFAAFIQRDSSSQVVLVADQRMGKFAGGTDRSFSMEECKRATPADWEGHEPTSLIVLLPKRLTAGDRQSLADLLNAARRWPIQFVGIVGTFRVHLDDPAAEEAERFALSLVRSNGIESRVAVFRPGLVLSPNSAVSRWLKQFGQLFPLAPRSLSTCFVDGEEFFAFVEAVRLQDERPADFRDPDEGVNPSTHHRYIGRSDRTYTMLGANLSWRQLLEQHRGVSVKHRLMTATASVLALIQIGQLIALVVLLLTRWTSWVKPWCVRTLEPRSIRELLSLCHRGNIDRVRVVGYNNGVNHFGHRYPGRTIVKTGRLCRTSHARSSMLKADCGTTIRDARDDLHEHGEELYVVPNYSYVALGTAFFVPIHGSAVDFSTVADTACRVVLYDPDRDQIVSATREEAAFRDNVYNPRSRAVVLRLYLRIKPKSSYFVRRETLKNAGAEVLLAALRDCEAANVEIRQAHAASDTVTISKYYTSPGDPSEPALESPRDTLGQLWDRLEENPVSSFLMHALSRHLAWHTELFFTPTEFELFWRTHAQIPLRKIQLRYIRRDGMPHSPFRDEDCVSADLFLFRYDKAAFDAYQERTFVSVRTNPGKHSN